VSTQPGYRTVLTTGANSGMGRQITFELARRGWRSIGSVRSAEKAEATLKAAAEAGVEVDRDLRRHRPRSVEAGDG
jgi:NAD(P)-dependent dehydrogenase (short-subunit alcohol dehydrogenase family)